MSNKQFVPSDECDSPDAEQEDASERQLPARSCLLERSRALTATLSRYYYSLVLVCFVLFLLLVAGNTVSHLYRNSGFAFLLQLVFLAGGLIFLNRSLSHLRIKHAVIVAAVLRLLFCLLVQPLPSSDFSALWTDALNAPEQPHLIFHSKSPLVILYYALIAVVFDDRLWAVYLVNSLIAGFQTYLIYSTVRTLRPGNSASPLRAAFLYALFPSLIYYSSLVSSEFVFLTLLLLGLLQFAKVITSNLQELPYRQAVVLGVAWGAAILARNTGVLFVPVILGAIIFGTNAGLLRRITLAVIAGATIVTLLLPQGVYNYTERGRFSLLSHPRSCVVLLFGTSRETEGRYNLEDIKRIERDYGVPYSYGNVTPEFEAVARKVARERILADPFDFFLFAVRDKFKHIWGNDNIVSFALRTSVPYKKLHGDVLPSARALDSIATNYYLGIWLLLGVLLVRYRRLDSFSFSCVHLILIVAGLHLIYEVQPRYHLSALPLAVLLVCLLPRSVPPQG